MNETFIIRRSAVLGFATATFLASALLFCVELASAKRILPLLGGSAAVWTTALVFFQVALLAGYFVAHTLSARSSLRRQSAVFLTLLGISIVQLAVTRHLRFHADFGHPAFSVLWMLAALIGLPFVTLSSAGPLLQSWFGRATGSQATYRLYVASNAGSMVGLIAYPWLIEPRFPVPAQAEALTLGVVLLLMVCAAIAYTLRNPQRDTALPTGADTPRVADRAGAPARAMWVLLAACASLLLSATTTHLTQDVAPIPLLWIVPLIAYLLSFIVAFSDARLLPRWLTIALVVPAVAIAERTILNGDLGMPVGPLIALHCGVLFVLCLFCHAELYRRRPHLSLLTTFYFHVAAGGAIGAVLAGIVAPLVLPANYELAIGLLFTTMLALAATWDSNWYATTFWAAASVLLGWLSMARANFDAEASTLRLRNFYGALLVTTRENLEDGAMVRTLVHGSIQHGLEVFRRDLAVVPSAYYGRTTGVGLAIDSCCGQRPRRVGVVGLGTGTLAAYGRAGDVIRFYDINPAIEPIARGLFTYLRDSRARVDVVAGDARLSLAAESPQRYDVLVIDAFAGDAIPVHLLTAEALALYRRHLEPEGAIAFHVSNTYLDLAPVVKLLADRARMSAILIASPGNPDSHEYPAHWVVVTNNAALVSALQRCPDRETITIPSALRPWTDDDNSLLPVLRGGP